MNFIANPIRIRRAVAIAALGLAAFLGFGAQAHASTPLTVHNVCHLNHGLGVVHSTTVEGEAVAYWDNNNDGKVDFLAYSDDGDRYVDVAAVVDSDGVTPADVAYCYQRNWTPVSKLEAHPQAAAGWTTGMSELTCVAGDIFGINPIGPDDEFTVGSPYSEPTCFG